MQKKAEFNHSLRLIMINRLLNILNNTKRNDSDVLNDVQKEIFDSYNYIDIARPLIKREAQLTINQICIKYKVSKMQVKYIRGVNNSAI